MEMIVSALQDQLFKLLPDEFGNEVAYAFNTDSKSSVSISRNQLLSFEKLIKEHESLLKKEHLEKLRQVHDVLVPLKQKFASEKEIFKKLYEEDKLSKKTRESFGKLVEIQLRQVDAGELDMPQVRGVRSASRVFGLDDDLDYGRVCIKDKLQDLLSKEMGVEIVIND